VPDEPCPGRLDGSADAGGRSLKEGFATFKMPNRPFRNIRLSRQSKLQPPEERGLLGTVGD